MSTFKAIGLGNISSVLVYKLQMNFSWWCDCFELAFFVISAAPINDFKLLVISIREITFILDDAANDLHPMLKFSANAGRRAPCKDGRWERKHVKVEVVNLVCSMQETGVCVPSQTKLWPFPNPDLEHDPGFCRIVQNWRSCLAIGLK